MLVNLNQILKKAQKERYAVGLFNTTDTDMLEAVIAAAEEMRSPVIIGTAEVLLPYGDLKLIAPSILSRAKAAHVPIAVHYDHGLTFERCLEALQLGFSSIMYDASAKPYAQNVAETCEIVKIAHAFGATVEGEIGHVGEAADTDGQNESLYTTPQQARTYIESTGIDACAVAVGTAHGTYKISPKLDFERISEIRAVTQTPLVLHGGSGLTDEDFKTCIAKGISKINIFTDLCTAGRAAMQSGISDHLDYLSIRNKKVEAIKNTVLKKIELFGSCGRA